MLDRMIVTYHYCKNTRSASTTTELFIESSRSVIDSRLCSINTINTRGIISFSDLSGIKNHLETNSNDWSNSKMKSSTNRSSKWNPESANWSSGTKNIVRIKATAKFTANIEATKKEIAWNRIAKKRLSSLKDTSKNLYRLTKWTTKA